MTDSRRPMRCATAAAVLALALAAGAVVGAGAGAGEDALARQVLQATGVQGGLVVHLGCGEGRLTAALRAGDAYLVHGLDADAGNVEKAREHIRSLGLYGPVSVERWSGKALPYADNLVNLVVAEDLGGVPVAEVLRVLAPQGVAYVKDGGRWVKTVKPRPKEIDEWTHYLHDATGNAVAQDAVVGPPRRVQWVGSPRWSRHHDHMASMSACVSAGGRVFYIIDEGPTASIRLPSKWSLVARDAFNGTILWRRPIEQWNTHFWPLKSGPAQLPRRLVAVGDRVYVTLALDGPLTVLDAATGRTLRTYEGTADTEEIIASGGEVFALVSGAASKWPEYRQKFTYVWDNSGHANRDWAWDEQKRTIVALQADTGKVLWRKDSPVAPLTLAADAGHVYFHDGEKVVCLDRAGGKEAWASEPVKRRTPMPVCFGPTLVAWKDVVLFAGGDRSMTGLDARTGKQLWTAPHPRGGHQSPEDLLVVGGLAWSGQIANGSDDGVFVGRDVRTGEIKSQFPPDVKTYWFHHRCYRAKATESYLLTSRTGIEFIDYKAKTWEPHHWVRGGCIYGVMPCNGLVYAPPHSCGCYLESKLCGFNALAPAAPAAGPAATPDAPRLEKGPAYDDGRSPQAAARDEADWPTYRHDAFRSGATSATVPAELKPAWQAELGGRLTQPVVAGGRLYVASIDEHTVHALDAATGRPAWRFTAGGRVDSPPTVDGPRVLFGSADGWVYCLRASNGALAWRFRAAAAERRVTAYEQIESAWPVSGSVLVQDGAAYCVAGRSMFLDGGLRLCRLDPASGRLLGETVLDDRDPESGKNLQVQMQGLTMATALPDVLSSDGKHLFMRSQRFDLTGQRQDIAPRRPDEQAGEGEHLFCMIGFLDDSWFHRSYWMYGRSVTGGYGGWFRAGRLAPSGRLLVCDEKAVYGYGRKPEYMTNASVLEYQLYAAERRLDESAIQRVTKAVRGIDAGSKKKSADSSDFKLRQGAERKELFAPDLKWSQDKPAVIVRAMAKAGRTLFVAGPPDVVDEQETFFRPDDPALQAKLAEQAAVLEGSKGALLWAVSAADGGKLTEYKLAAPPVFDGLAAAAGKLYLATTDGKVVCFSGK